MGGLAGAGGTGGFGGGTGSYGTGNVPHPLGFRPPVLQAPAAAAAAPAAAPAEAAPAAPPRTGGPLAAPPPPVAGAGNVAVPQPTTNTSANDPRLDDLYKRLQGRFGADVSARAIDKSNAGIADAAALLGKDARAGLAQRGALGSGVHAAFVTKNITDPALRQAAGAAADISMGEEKRQDALTLGGLGIAGAQSDVNLRQQANANQQYATSAQLAIAQEQARAQQQQQQWAQWQALMSSI